ncbi:C40 family peptidase [Lacrimispora amygdalina]|uniref:C40 family peptidase n=1 Tax=Lacrimispora amygdalina TaxID=253257 RepID=UPI000BE36983|nr:SH3 domain-containing C40 family peptidase [Lacrimispora amygdalina]
MKQFAVIRKPVISIWDRPEEIKENRDRKIISSIADEGIYGMGLRISGEEEMGFYPVMTAYQYPGYVRKEDVELTSLSSLMKWEEGGLMVTNGEFVDLMSIPKIQGVRIMSVPRGALIKVIEFESMEPGWALVELFDGQRGFMRNQYLRPKEYSQSGLWTGELPQKEIVDEREFRKAVVENAMQYLGTQYRWGGRTSLGIDCSGLASESYLLSGIIIFRDAKIQPGFPVREIPKEEMLPGDLMYFPGHIAMYIGDGRYIHSTGKIGNSGVVINSLNTDAADYRDDLTRSWYASGSIF